MLKTIVSTLFIIFIMQSSFSHAHGGGHARINDQQAINIATDVAAQLSDRDAGLGFGTLDPSWKTLPDASKTIHTKGNDYYIVKLKHDSLNKEFYVLMSASGEVYDANFTGEFKGLK